MTKKKGSDKKDIPVLNEELLSKLLEAAYVLQEHNRRTHEMELSVELDGQEGEGPIFQRSAVSRASTDPSPAQEEAFTPDYTAILAQIVETQHKIQLRNLKLEDAMMLVAERVREIASAGGSAIAILDGKRIRYRAAAGAMALPAGTEVSAEKALCAACVRTGQVIRAANINAEFLVDSRECQRRGIQSMIAVPVYHEGRIAGGLELFYSTPQAFTEENVHTCQLMAGLVTEALARDEETTWRQSLATERKVVLDALLRLDPSRAQQADAATNEVSGITASAIPCRNCGHQLAQEENFCGKCGTARASEPTSPAAPEPISPGTMHEAAKQSTPASQSETGVDSSRLHPGKPLAESIEQEMPDLFSPVGTGSHELGGAMVHRPVEIADHSHQPFDFEADDMEQDSDAAEISAPSAEPAADWSSAAAARAFLQQVAGGNPDTFARFWRARRGDIYLAIAGVLVAAVIGWGVWSDHPVGAAANTAAAGHKKAPDADLSLLDRMLISLGLAEAPQPPESKGNPDTQVWVDLHTALYYCPGSDLYGKTPKGKFTTQRDAQLDQFEPAYRKTCE